MVFFATTSASIGTAVVSTAYSSAILGTGNMAAFGEPYSHDQWVKDIYIGAALGAAGGIYQYLVTPRVIPGGYVTVDPDELARNGFGGVIDDLGQPVSGSLAGQSPYSYGTGAGAAETSTSLVKTGTQFSKHSLQRLAQRGVTQDMAELAISKGQKFYDPLNKSINYVLPNGFASGKSLLVGTNPLTGEVTTVIRSSKNLINSRFIPIK